MTLLSADSPEPSPWRDRRSLWYACGALIVWAITRRLAEAEAFAPVALFSIVRLLVACWLGWALNSRLLPRPQRPPAALVLALPFPVDLVFLAYVLRMSWLPLSLADGLSSPTAFLIFLGGTLLLTIPLTTLLVDRATGERYTQTLRQLSILLFLAVAAALLLPLPQWSTAFLRYFVEPLALCGFAIVAGAASRSLNDDRAQ